MRTRPLQDMVEGETFIVDMGRKYPQASGRVQSGNRRKWIKNMAGRLNWAMRGEREGEQERKRECRQGREKEEERV